MKADFWPTSIFGDRLITGGVNSVSIWDVSTGAELLELVPRNAFGFDASQDGRWLYHADHMVSAVRVYAVELEDGVALAQDHLARSMSDEECRQYLHLETCPESQETRWGPSHLGAA